MPSQAHYIILYYIWIYIYIYIYIQRITMCPHGYHHSGYMATPALGTWDVLHIYIYKGLQCALTAITIVALCIYIHIVAELKVIIQNHLGCSLTTQT